MYDPHLNPMQVFAVGITCCLWFELNRRGRKWVEIVGSPILLESWRERYQHVESDPLISDSGVPW